MEAMTLWRDYQETGADEAREALLTRHLPLVHHVARKMLRMLSSNADLDDMISAGTMGLMDAVGSFDPNRGLAFSTYAAPRIRGAILDELRRIDELPRSARRKQRAMQAAEQELTRTLDRAPTARETAQHLGVDLETLWEWRRTADEGQRFSLDDSLPGRAHQAGTAGDLLPGTGAEEIEERVEKRERLDQVQQELAALSERERMVLTLYYFHELKLREIAEVLGLTESRVSQIRSRALETLRTRVQNLKLG